MISRIYSMTLCHATRIAVKVNSGILVCLNKRILYAQHTSLAK